MAVTSIVPLPERKGRWDRLYRRYYTLPWRVECSDPDDGPVVIRHATTGSPPVPWMARIGAFYFLNGVEFDTGSFLVDIDYDQEHAGSNPSSSVWKVTMQFEPYDTTTFGQEPTAWPIRVSFGQQKFESLATNDAVSGNPIVNSAGDPFDEPVTRDDTRTLITVIRNEPIGGLTPFDFTKPATFRDSVNRYAWNGFAPFTVKCDSITTGEPVFDSNSLVYYMEVTYQFTCSFALNPNDGTMLGWKKALLDQGYQTLQGGKATPIVNNGQQVDDPVLLDGSGGELPSGGTPVYLVFDQYKPLDWTALGIDFATALGVG